MIRPIIKDVLFLGQKSEPASKRDLGVGQDLVDTLAANRDRCVGMAANMIGVKKRIIIVDVGFTSLLMFNPVITRKDSPYETKEGCLSLTGVRKTTRYQNIEVQYFDKDWQRHKERFTGKIAQIIQHEVDHTKGIVI